MSDTQQALVSVGGATQDLPAIMAFLDKGGAALTDAQVALLRSHGWPVPAAEADGKPHMMTMQRPANDGGTVRSEPSPAVQPIVIQMLPDAGSVTLPGGAGGDTVGREGERPGRGSSVGQYGGQIRDAPCPVVAWRVLCELCAVVVAGRGGE